MRFIFKFSVFFVLLFIWTNCTSPTKNKEVKVERSKYSVERIKRSELPSGIDLKLVSTTEEIVKTSQVKYDIPMSFFKNKQGELYSSLNSIFTQVIDTNVFNLEFSVAGGPFLLFSCFLNEEGVVYQNSPFLLKEIHADSTKDKEFYELSPQIQVISPQRNQVFSVDKVLIDIFPCHTSLSKEENYLSIIVDDKEEMMIKHEDAFYLKGLTKGKHKLTIELRDTANLLIPGPFNKVERKIEIK